MSTVREKVSASSSREQIFHLSLAILLFHTLNSLAAVLLHCGHLHLVHSFMSKCLSRPSSKSPRVLFTIFMASPNLIKIMHKKNFHNYLLELLVKELDRYFQREEQRFSRFLKTEFSILCFIKNIYMNAVTSTRKGYLKAFLWGTKHMSQLFFVIKYSDVSEHSIYMPHLSLFQ